MKCGLVMDNRFFLISLVVVGIASVFCCFLLSGLVCFYSFFYGCDKV